MPSLAIGAAAFGAGELILHTKEKIENNQNNDVYETIKEAKSKSLQIQNMISKIEDENLRQNIREICETTNKIIDTVERKPEKFKKINHFFDYYLPVTYNILKKYDEIENQKLSSNESKKFMKQTQGMIEKINVAFKEQLSNLYQSDIVNTDAEMKVFDSMLKHDGYDVENDFNVKKEE